MNKKDLLYDNNRNIAKFCDDVEAEVKLALEQVEFGDLQAAEFVLKQIIKMMEY